MSLDEITGGFDTPQVRVEETETGWKKALLIDDGYEILVKDNAGTAEDPYEVRYQSNLQPERTGRLFFSLANQDPNEPKDIYGDVNDVIFRFCPAEEIPVQIHRLLSESHREQAIGLQGRILEAIKPGLSEILNL